MTRCWKVFLWVKLYLWSLYPGRLWQIFFSPVLKNGIVPRRINSAAFYSHTRSFGKCVTICLSLQTVIMFSIIVNLSSLPLFVYLYLFSLSLLSLFWQSGGCDSRQRCAPGRLSSSWSQHHVSAASRVRLHRQSAGWQVQIFAQDTRKCTFLIQLLFLRNSVSPLLIVL